MIPFIGNTLNHYYYFYKLCLIVPAVFEFKHSELTVSFSSILRGFSSLLWFSEISISDDYGGVQALRDFFLWRVIYRIEVECHFLCQRYKKTDRCCSYEDHLSNNSVRINTTNMRTLMLLVLTIAVTGSKNHRAGENLLMEIVDNVDEVLKQNSTTVRTEINYFIWFWRAKQCFCLFSFFPLL